MAVLIDSSVNISSARIFYIEKDRKDRTFVLSIIMPKWQEGVVLMGNLNKVDWKKVHQMKKAFDERFAVPVSDLKVEPEGEPGEELMTNEEWLLARQADFSSLEKHDALTSAFKKHLEKHTIHFTVCASEAAAATADEEASSPWVSKTELWNMKRGNRPIVEKPMNTAALQRGHNAEDYVLYLAERVLNDKYGAENVYIWQDKRIFASRRYPWMFCDTDGHAVAMVNGKPKFILIEAKTVGVRNYKAQKIWLSGHVPEYYGRQCRHEMATFCASECLIIAAWSLETDGFAYKFIKRDMAAEKRLIDAEREFVQSLEDNKEPEDLLTPVLTSSFYGRLYAEEKNEPVELTKEQEEDVRAIQDADIRIQNLKNRILDIEDEKARHTNRLASVLKNNSTGRLPVDGGVFIVREKRGHKNNGFDFERFKEDHPDLYDKSVYQIKKINQDALDGFKEYDEYVIPGEPNGNVRWSVEFVEDKEE